MLQKNHFEKVCRKRNVEFLKQQSLNMSSDSEEFFIGMVSSSQNKDFKAWYTDINFNVKFKLDTGA